MGRSNGAEVCGKILDSFYEMLDAVDREGNVITYESEKEFVRKVIKTFEDFDCDTLDELIGEVSDAVDEVLKEEGYINDY